MRFFHRKKNFFLSFKVDQLNIAVFLMGLKLSFQKGFKILKVDLCAKQNGNCKSEQLNWYIELCLR